MEIFAGCQSSNFASGANAQATTAQSKALETSSAIVKGSEINAILKNFMKTSKSYVFKPSSVEPQGRSKSFAKKISNSIDAVIYLDSDEKTVCYYAKGYTDSGKKIPVPADSSGMFEGLKYLTEIDLSGFDFGSAVSMKNMFASCVKLKSVDFTAFKTGRVTDMSGMFSNCKELTSLNLSAFDTSMVSSMKNMFYGCTKLSSLNLSSFSTGRVTDMSGMFYQCYELTALDLSKFDTKNVTDMKEMFYFCEKLPSLNLTKFNTGKVTDMSGMFRGCRAIA